MESFDFKAPFDRTIIFVENDGDDESTASIKRDEDQPDDGYCDKTNIDNLDSLEDHIHVDTKTVLIDHSLLAQIKTENSKLEEIADDQKQANNTEDRLSSSNESTIHEIISVQNKRNYSDLGGHKNEEIPSKMKKDIHVRSSILMHETKRSTSDNEKKQITNKVVGTIGKYDDVGNTNSAMPVESNSDESMKTLKYTVRTRDEEDLTYFIKNIFDTISQNLILCMQAYQEHLNIVNDKTTSQTSPAARLSKKRYLNLQNRYFQLSYCAVVDLILPQEDKYNNMFIEEFLNNTVRYGKEKLNIIYSKQDIQPFYYELISWAKKEKINLEKKGSYYGNKNDEFQRKQYMNNESPLLSMQLAQPPIFPVQTKLQRKINQPTHIRTPPNIDAAISGIAQPLRPGFQNFPRPSILPKYQDVVLPAQVPHYSNVGRSCPTSLPKYSDLEIPSAQPHNSNWAQLPVLPDYENLQRHNEIPTFTGRNPDKEVTISVDHVRLDILRQKNQIPQNIQESDNFHSTGYFSNQSHVRNQLKDLNYGISLSEQELYLEKTNQTHMSSSNSRVEAISSIHNNPYVSNNPVHKSQWSNNYYHQNNMNVNQPTLHTACYNSFTSYVRHQPYSGQDKHNSLNETISITDKHLQNELLSTQANDHHRSSVSTDSGFASPLQFYPASDGTASTTENGQLAPMITHVTSLNPNAMHIAEGSCHVCSAVTKKKCLGCYQSYYCSTACQMMDWSRHKELCKMIHHARMKPS